MSYCYNCGNLLGERDKFCTNCGVKTEYLISISGNALNTSAENPNVLRHIEPIIEIPDPVVSETKMMRKAYSRSGFGAILVYAAMLVGSLAAMAVFFMALFASGEYNDISEGGILSDVMNRFDGDMQTIASLLGSFIGMLAGFFLMKAMTKKLPKKRIEKKRLTFAQYLMFIAISYCVWVAGIVLGCIPDYLGASRDASLEMSLGTMLLYSFYAVFGAPVFEELVFRKALIDGLNGYGETVSAFTSALLFGLIHGNGGQFFLAYFLGLVFAVCYQRTGKIIYTMGLHMIINFTATAPDLVMTLLHVPDDKIRLFEIISRGCLFVIGLLVIILCRKSKMLVLERPDLPGANRAAFRNPGMIIAAIGGFVMLAENDILVSFTTLTDGTLSGGEINDSLLTALKDAGLKMISVSLALVVVLMTIKCVGKHVKVRRENTENTQESDNV